MMEFYFIRHGETQWNCLKRIQGSQDMPLNETGRRQAAAMVRQMRDIPLDRVYSSDLIRARDTAGLLGADRGLVPVIIPGLREISYGRWEGMQASEIRRLFPQEYARWWADTSSGAPGGESREQVSRRLDQAMRQIVEQMREQGARRAAIISHGASLSLLFALLLKEHTPVENGFGITNCAVTRIDCDTKTNSFQLVYFNKTEL